MGDRTLSQRGQIDSKRAVNGVHWSFTYGDLTAKMFTPAGNNLVMVAWNRWNKVTVASWVIDAWLYESLRNEWEEDPMSKWLKGLQSVVKPAPDQPAATDKDFAKLYPALYDFMTCTINPTGGLRQTCSLTVFCEGGQFKVVLAERQEDLSLWATALSFNEALEVLDAQLQSGRPQWRLKGKRQPKKA